MLCRHSGMCRGGGGWGGMSGKGKKSGGDGWRRGGDKR